MASHGVHAVQHEVEHQLKHEDGHGGKPHGGESTNKRIALLISVIALFLAFSETLGKSAQTAALSYNVEASNLWAFFQAKTIRRTLVETAAQEMAGGTGATSHEGLKAAQGKQLEFWKQAAARYRSEPKKGPRGEELGEGSDELAKRALDAQVKRDDAMAKYHHYEVASAAFQIGIVLASATVITGMIVLAWIACGLAALGLGFMGIAMVAPHAVHLF